MNRIVVLDLIMTVSDGFLSKHVSESKKADRCYQMSLMVTRLAALLSEWPVQ